MASYEDEVTESLALTSTGPLYYSAAALLDNLTLSETQTLAWRWGGISDEMLELAESTVTKTTYGLTVTEALRLQSLLTIAEFIAVVEALECLDTPAARLGVQLQEMLSAAHTSTASAKYGVAFSEAMLLRDTLKRFIQEVISLSLTVSEVLTPLAKYMQSASESLSVTETTDTQLTMHVVAQDGFEVASDLLSRMIYQPTVLERLHIEIEAVNPGGGVTTWVLNTKTNALTEYQNFNFTSFGRCGMRYVATANDGLYELVGDRDYGAVIISDIKSGLMQIGGSQFTSFKGAYIGVRGDGDYYLKLDTGNGKSYTYQVTAKSYKTAKVDFGKGLRSRYFSFELISTGQDFDLDSIEFLPIVASRRA